MLLEHCVYKHFKAKRPYCQCCAFVYLNDDVLREMLGYIHILFFVQFSTHFTVFLISFCICAVVKSLGVFGLGAWQQVLLAGQCRPTYNERFFQIISLYLSTHDDS